MADSSRRIYRISLATWAWLLTGEQPRARRRGALPPSVPVTLLDDPGLPVRLAMSFVARAANANSDTVNRELSILRAAIGWWHSQGWITGDPSHGLSRLPAPPDRTRALSQDEVAAVLRLDVSLREKTYWRLLYESAARADEVLTLDVGDLNLRNKRARIVAKGARWSGYTGSPAPPSCCRGCSAGARPVRSSSSSAGRQPGRRPSMSVRSPAARGSPTGGPRSSSPTRPGGWSAAVPAGPCASSATPTSHTRPRLVRARPRGVRCIDRSVVNKARDGTA